ncbi:cap-specific mRNA (nucleoside-2'-O-)-methyltransferase 2-like [Teleopsis dalmanni]|uniref:cap-specific mRNA (nucleoside-2'-O-)-methyltransferase 2-like n=1 Tax=Teleopsis dalmanni TaxID=139649 RepID=UPI0018CD2CE9|nr:cap-specific mRNA (nucleoside-2'-O-)-methyltransferase 2-like [Teleopsis dalmanni]
MSATKCEVLPQVESINSPKPAMASSSDHITEEEVNQVFEKKFGYIKPKTNSKWVLPPAAQLFQEFYQIETLQQLKRTLNSVKGKLNDYAIEEWSTHTRRMDPSGDITWRLKNEINAEFVTIAWCKLYECLHKFPLVKKPKLNTLHLCEAPGAFISALNHYLYSTYNKEQVEWKWLSTTLNPYYEGNPFGKMISDHRFMLRTLDHWLFHEDFTGNIMCNQNIKHMHERCLEYFDGDADLITADGSIDCVENPDCQESNTSILHFAEMLAALTILGNGGSFVLKLFTLFEAITVSKLFLLNCVFEEVHVFKPATSKRGNSENYIICLGYKKDTKHLADTLKIMKKNLDEQNNLLPIFGFKQLPKDFLMQHEVCTRIFMNHQIQAIESNIYVYESKSKYMVRRSNAMRRLVSKEFFKRYQLKSIPAQLKILHQCENSLEISYKTGVYKGSYSEREQLKTKPKEQQIYILCSSVNELEKLFIFKNGVLYEELRRSTEKSDCRLKIYIGKPVAKLESSLFVSLPVLLLYHKLQDLLTYPIVCQNSPKCIINNDVEIPFCSTGFISFADMQLSFFIAVVNAIYKLRPTAVAFENMAFLTHFSVSLLRFLSRNVFTELKITTDPTHAIYIKCEHEHGFTDAAVDAITSLHGSLANKQQILCFTDISELHRNKFGNRIMEYNNQILIKKFKSILFG